MEGIKCEINFEDVPPYLGTGSAFFETVLGGGGGAGCVGAGYTLGWDGWNGDLGICPFLSPRGIPELPETE